MFHSITTILTTTAVALHAMLGCCVHHAHFCDSHESRSDVATAVEADHHCSHGHHHHDDSGSPDEDVTEDSGHEHGGGGDHKCDEGDCTFTSVERSNDLELMLAFSMWCQPLDDAAATNAIDSLLSLHSAAETPPDTLSLSGSARAKTQVWRL